MGGTHAQCVTHARATTHQSDARPHTRNTRSVECVSATSTSASCWVGRPQVLGTVALPEIRAQQRRKAVLGLAQDPHMHARALTVRLTHTHTTHQQSNQGQNETKQKWPGPAECKPGPVSRKTSNSERP
eukprot:2934575-Amphidinium_carterae.1